jgi:hypothetical protein
MNSVGGRQQQQRQQQLLQGSGGSCHSGCVMPTRCCELCNASELQGTTSTCIAHTTFNHL